MNTFFKNLYWQIQYRINGFYYKPLSGGSTITKPNTFSAGAVIVASEHNSNFDTIYNDYNGSITNVNISASAAIAATKLNLASIAQTMAMSSVAINFAKGSDIASATTTDIGAMAGNYPDVTGTTTITGLGTVQAGTVRYVRFTGALTLTHNATSLLLPNNASNITTVANDTAGFVSLGSGNWKCLWYQRYDGTPLSGGNYATQAEMETATSNTVNVTPGRTQYHPGVVKAWGLLVGTGTPAFTTSHNLDASVTDNGTGDYSITFTTDFSSANYIMVSAGMNSSQAANDAGSPVVDFSTAKLTTGVRIRTPDNAGSPSDRAQSYIAFIGDQ